MHVSVFEVKNKVHKQESSENKAVLKPLVSPAFAITYFYNHCDISPTPTGNTWKNVDTVAEFRSFVMNNKAFGNLFCNSQKRFHTSPGSSDSNNRGYRSFFKLHNGICIYKKS